MYSSPAIGSDGTIYVGSDDYKLYAIYGSGSLAGTPWPMFHHDLKHTGRVGVDSEISIDNIGQILRVGEKNEKVFRKNSGF